MNIDVKTMILEYLKKYGYDGLCNDECGCGIDRLAPCGELLEKCTAALKGKDGLYYDSDALHKNAPTLIKWTCVTCDCYRLYCFTGNRRICVNGIEPGKTIILESNETPLICPKLKNIRGDEKI